MTRVPGGAKTLPVMRPGNASAPRGAGGRETTQARPRAEREALLDRTGAIPGTRAGSAAPAIASTLFATGCDPVVEVGGSFLPAWMPCLVAGAALAAILQAVFARTGIDEHVGPRPVVYGCIAAIGAMTTWLLLFGS